MMHFRILTAPTYQKFLGQRRRCWLFQCWFLASCSCCQGFFLLSQYSADRYTKSERCYAYYNAIHSRGRLFSTASTTSCERHVCILQNVDNIHHSNLAQQVAQSLSLPILTVSELTAQKIDEQGFTHILCIEDYPESILPKEEQYALAIQPTNAGEQSSSKRQKRRSNKKIGIMPKIKPFSIDLCPPKLTKRTGQPDLLIRAVAPQRVPGGAVVYDLTAGWAQDSLLLALQGGASQVCMVERDPIVACLLKDAVRRVKCIAQSTTSSSWQRRASELDSILSLQVGDGRDVLMNACDGSAGENAPDIVYLDPMFPPRTKTAAVKKGMQILHGLFETNLVAENTSSLCRDQEEAELLKLAYEKAKFKVVVKRPIHAPALGNDGTDLKPSQVVKGSINRWDVYVKS